MHIHVITHALDDFDGHDHYMLAPIVAAMREDGHTVSFGRGVEESPPPADLAIMHVDLTVVPPEYREYAAQFPRCANLAVDDISKRRISDAVLTPESDWTGRVMVKANLNCSGIPERRRGLVSRLRNASALPGKPAQYATYRSFAAVPPAIRDDPELIVERFVPEKVGDFFTCRFWTFSGEAERCTQVFTQQGPIVKASGLSHFEYCEVPEAMREKRAQLGFDYGKFDFVIHDGEVILLDANKTPGTPPVSNKSQWPIDYARGLIGLVE